jgi:hypothetical protein
MRIPSMLLCLGLVLLASPGRAHAQNPEKVFSGRIMVSNKAFPLTAKSGAAYVSALRKQSKTSLVEDREKRQWKVYFAAFLKQGPGDLEVVIKVFDLTSRQQSPLVSFEQFIGEPKQRTIISNMVLTRKQVGVNKDLLMVIEYRGRQLAAGRFRILGEAEKFTGKVDFSEDEEESKEE